MLMKGMAKRKGDAHGRGLDYTGRVPLAPTLSRIHRGLDARGRSRIRAAYRFCEEHLSSLRRRSGESYAQHGFEVTCVLREMSADASLLCVAVLHDVLVHPQGSDLLRAAPLTEAERELILQLHPLRRLHIDANTEELDQALSAFMRDPRLLPLRMAHRLNDVRHLDRFHSGLRKQIATESLHIYTAIAGQLGMQNWRQEMEDICFPMLLPSIVEHLRERFAECRAMDEACLRHGRRFLMGILRQAGIACAIDMRIKGLYSTYRKMVIKRRRFHELTDRLALRIIVGTEDECYKALGIVHRHMHPVPGKLKDYIGAPKENGYRSIHTVVHPLPGVSEQPIEIQIRTRDMHRECEFGPASHGDYKNVSYALNTKISRANLYRNLRNLQEHRPSARQFERALRIYFSDEHLAVFDSANNLHHLRRPATAMDFVCAAFPLRFHQLREVRINGRRRPIDVLLHDGDIVDALFGDQTTARPDWAAAANHTDARKLIRMHARGE